MYVAWGIGSDNSIKDDTEDVALMTVEDSEPDSKLDIEKREERGLVKLGQKFSIFQRSKGEFVLGVSKITEDILEDVPCEGEYFGDPTVEQSSVVRLNLGASSEGKFVPLTNSIEIKDDSIEIRVVNFGKQTMLLGKNAMDYPLMNYDLEHVGLLKKNKNTKLKVELAIDQGYL
ncbi:hypothetical protein H5410_030875 [Solanum commersonii]|uniref:Uncharacterized protein n=1 Tax=Solanum commersonii TaxID=4109 RepID=A0A9J5YGX4_SOLCO|nr:hypothetical protein H5410_030875 [Solanum commersonii]